MGGGRENSVSSSSDHLIFIGALVGPCALVAERIGTVLFRSLYPPVKLRKF